MNRNRRQYSIRWMTGTAMMIALIIVLASTPLGLIRLPFLTATTLHIPVIIATLVLGLEAGVLTGLVFGVTSLITNLTGASFFAPFFINPLVSVFPRMLFPVCVFWIAQALKQLTKGFDQRRLIAYIGASALGTALHTAMVMGMIYLLNRAEIAQMIQNGAGVPQAIAEKGVGMGIAALGLANGIPEMIVAAVIAPVVTAALEKALGKMKK
ncbi:MAG: ECF transporter S component [Clostridia bacterium]|nr:ECF transporter S component [Clostridia bacterium]